MFTASWIKSEIAYRPTWRLAIETANEGWLRRRRCLASITSLNYFGPWILFLFVGQEERPRFPSNTYGLGHWPWRKKLSQSPHHWSSGSSSAPKHTLSFLRLSVIEIPASWIRCKGLQCHLHQGQKNNQTWIDFVICCCSCFCGYG